MTRECITNTAYRGVTCDCNSGLFQLSCKSIFLIWTWPNKVSYDVVRLCSNRFNIIKHLLKQLCCRQLNEVAKLIQHCCLHLRTKEKLINISQQCGQMLSTCKVQQCDVVWYWVEMSNLFVKGLMWFSPVVLIWSLLKVVLRSKNHFYFSSDFETLFTKHSPSEILSLNFKKKTVYLNCNFPI